MILSPSLMCCNFDHLADEVQQLEKAGADRFHLDVMDGRFVPNFSLGLQDIKSICANATIETELHLMIEQPGNYIDLFAKTGVDIISIHPESEFHPATTLQKILEAGKVPGIVISPGVSVSSIKELLCIVTHVTIMAVNPGHAGQVYLPYVDGKISELLALKDHYEFEIIIDGACSEEKIRIWNNAGVDGFVLGTAALFGKAYSYNDIFTQLRSLNGK